MNKFVKKLPILAFLLGAVGAFAFNTSSPVSEEIWGEDENGWHNVTELEYGKDYQCNASTEQCLYDDVDGNPIPNETGTFELLNP
ncbi:hypothetical protein KZP23_08550 [Echinicola marina]|uniref:DUF6520 family protein n=1 Tax=Echinicola marina TaxID=2859768 RepID=UPI001CF61E80|nr:DUF6520 family protein [Echinicola marina]UCS95044.1 hypothetical protein KZP23_08550 [Echinicola marina]